MLNNITVIKAIRPQAADPNLRSWLLIMALLK